MVYKKKGFDLEKTDANKILNKHGSPDPNLGAIMLEETVVLL